MRRFNRLGPATLVRAVKPAHEQTKDRGASHHGRLGFQRLKVGALALAFALGLPGLATAACSGNPGDLGLAGESYMLADNSVVSCAGLLIVNEASQGFGTASQTARA